MWFVKERLVNQKTCIEQENIYGRWEIRNLGLGLELDNLVWCEYIGLFGKRLLVSLLFCGYTCGWKKFENPYRIENLFVIHILATKIKFKNKNKNMKSKVEDSIAHTITNHF